MRTEKSDAYTYIEKSYPKETTLMQQSRQFAESLGLGAISISQTEGHLIRFLLDFIQPRKIVEIGTLTGLSCQYFLQSLQADGTIYSLEKSKEHFQLATQVLQPWIQSGQCHLILGDAKENLPTLNQHGPFDAIFIDGNKSAYKDYWTWAKANIRSGGLILVDNVFLAGAVWGDLSKQKFSSKQIGTVASMNQEILADSDFVSSFVPTSEGLLLARRK